MNTEANPAPEATAPVESTELWAVLEVMGHERIAGKITEKPIGNSIFMQVDVPASDKLPGFTRLYHPNSLFSFTPVPEQVARIMAGSLQKTAVSVHLVSTGESAQVRQLLGIPEPPKRLSFTESMGEDDGQNDDDAY